ncbi:hypothetical protein FNV43_RR26539 [Rhamnella rubrinervis]|uniref:Uncharacterized protein n=1 Tax=Rhamnella rubrinervis TaxID=2594499 RepID=A0A8K0GPB7_9ROSA|nr:hypothetical protein FNV43_RR26539 [Rhamnella rubrinervis]
MSNLSLCDMSLCSRPKVYRLDYHGSHGYRSGPIAAGPPTLMLGLDWGSYVRNCGEVLASSCARTVLGLENHDRWKFWLMEAFGKKRSRVAAGVLKKGSEDESEELSRVSEGRLIFPCSEEHSRMFDKNHGVGNTHESLWLGGGV